MEKLLQNKGIKADQFGIESTFTHSIHVDGVVWFYGAWEIKSIGEFGVAWDSKKSTFGFQIIGISNVFI